MSSERNRLPGGPSNARIRDVRRTLKNHGITPTYKTWQLTWEWAAKVARSYYRTSWPLASEIAAQYMVLLLAEIQASGLIRSLPYRAGEYMPDSVRKLLPERTTATLIKLDTLPDEPSTQSQRLLELVGE